MATTLKTFIVDATAGKTESDTGYSDFATFVGTDMTATGAKDVKVITCPLGTDGNKVLLICTKTVA